MPVIGAMRDHNFSPNTLNVGVYMPLVGFAKEGKFMFETAVIVAAGRTAIGNFGGKLANIEASSIGAIVICELLKRSGIETSLVDDVVMGQVITAGTGQNPARQAALEAGLPESSTASTLNMVCGSGLRAVQLAAQAIASGDSQVVIAGGQENMSLAPHILPKSRSGRKMGDWKLADSMIIDGLWDAFYDCHMGITAENIAKKYAIDRKQQDEFAAHSQAKAHAAIRSGRFADEIIPVKLPQHGGEDEIFVTDEYPRPATTPDKLATLKPAFSKEGSVTAGNSSGINDGAAALVVMSKTMAEEMGLKIMAQIKASAFCGVNPQLMGTGPVPATRNCLAKAGWQVDDLDLIEANEAFAAQAIYVNKELGIDPEKVNVNGGSIALGHPIGASGARILVTLVHEMLKRDLKRGLATLCIGGGMGIAVALER
jgi:acetyl-CoA C-acetyltransferase